jgi:hypothetical protein
MKLKNIKHLDDKIKRYEGIDILFKNDHYSDSMSINISNVQKEIVNNKTMGNQSCNKKQKDETI